MRRFADCETQEGLEALRDILAGLTPEEFAGGAVRGLVCVDDPSDAVVRLVVEEGVRRVNDLLKDRRHFLAAKTALVCTPAVFFQVCREGLVAHEDAADPVRVAILDLFGEEPEFVNELWRRLEEETE
jgi:hypothetical protein